ncbi:MAG TPA: DUF1385 domain-containing protein [Fimbriimonas sp.]
MDQLQSDLLSKPVGALMRPAAYVAPEDSVSLAGARLRESGVGLVAVTEGQQLVGQIGEGDLARLLADGALLTDGVGSRSSVGRIVRPYETGAQALRTMAASNLSALLVADDGGRLMGVVTPSDLLPRKRPILRPPLVGGMATPFGVYLTTGTVSGGAKWYGLVATGMLLFCLLVAAQLAGSFTAELLSVNGSPMWLTNLFVLVLPVVLFFLGMRLLPLAGTHAAEHQVVHAIERGEELVPSVVRRMPRVHPRCGTNLAVGLSLFLGLSGMDFVPNHELRLLLALVVTAAAWRPLGSILQFYVTTKPANDRQLASGIRAGQELLERYQSTRAAYASVPMRIWNSGVLHVIGGSLFAYALVAGLSILFGWNLEL